MEAPNPDDPNGYIPPPPSSGGSGKCSSAQVASGFVETQIDSSGNFNPQLVECVSGDEADRRRNINYPSGPTGGKAGAAAGGGGTQAPVGPAKLPAVPQFNPGPAFSFGEVFKAPTLDEAQNEPGYAFARDQGLGALQHSQAAQGLVRSGGSLKDLIGWGNKFAEQNYGNVFDRYTKGYDTRLRTAEDIYGLGYQREKDMYAPKLIGYQNETNAAQNAWQKMWDKYFNDTVSANTIYGNGLS